MLPTMLENCQDLGGIVAQCIVTVLLLQCPLTLKRWS